MKTHPQAIANIPRCRRQSPRCRAAFPPGPWILTRREREVLRLVARGEADLAIAATLFVSRRTVNSHVAHIQAKLDVPSRGAAVVAAAQRAPLRALARKGSRR
jgi:DNA-binding CsgD family transcriptional regulator